jgi:hypothetical protein
VFVQANESDWINNKDISLPCNLSIFFITSL